MSRTEWLIAILATALAAAGLFVGAVTGNAAAAGGLIALAPVVVVLYQSVQTRQAVEVGRGQMATSLAMIEEVRRDRELAVGVRIVFGNPYYTTDTGGGFPGVALRNIGRGTAIGLRVVQRRDDEVFWSDPIVIPSGGAFPTTGPGNFLSLSHHCSSANCAPPVYAGAVPPDDIYVYCFDEIGDGLRFRIRSGEEPERWRRGESRPSWAGTLDEPFQPCGPEGIAQ